MTDQDLSDLLESAADRTPVNPAPIVAMLAHQRRRRTRRTTLAAVAATAALVAVVGGSAALTQAGDGPSGPTGGGPAPTSASPHTTGVADAELDGRWVVVQLFGADGQPLLSASSTSEVELTFDHGQLSGTTGCNDIFGRYAQSGDLGEDIAFQRNALGSTQVGCSDEPPLVRRLLDVRHVTVAGDGRDLTDAAGVTVATLDRAGSDQPLGFGPRMPAPLTPEEVTVATSIGKQKQGEVEGTFIGATAFATIGTPFDRGGLCDQSKRLVTIRLVWKADANFVHGGVPGGPPDGPRKALLITVYPATEQVCETGAVYRNVGANPSETLLYGEWPGKK